MSGKPDVPDAPALLGSVAAALTACESAGLHVKLRHGAIDTRYGYVLPAGGEWVARTRLWSPFSPGDDTEED